MQVSFILPYLVVLTEKLDWITIFTTGITKVGGH